MLSTVQSKPPSKSSPWQPGSWAAKPIEQAVAYPDPAALAKVLSELARRPALVSAGEIDELPG